MEALGKVFRVDVPRFRDGRQKTMWNGIEKKGFPNLWVRWCCQQLKEYSGRGRYVVMGVRWAESPKRKNRGIHELLKNKAKDKIVLNNDNVMKRKLLEICGAQRKVALNPVIDWSDNEVWQFLRDRKVPINPLYDQGYKRIGCIGCPLAGKKQQRKDFEIYPRYRDAYFKAGKRYIAYRKARGLPKKDFMETPEKYFRRWLGEKSDQNGTYESGLLWSAGFEYHPRIGKEKTD
jgi:phosphoadenosine phosphosulfate reductase